MAPDDQLAGSGNNKDPAGQGRSRWWTIADYLSEARQAGVLDEETYRRLFLFLDTGFGPAVTEPTSAESVVADEPELVAVSEPRERTASDSSGPPVVGPTPSPFRPTSPPAEPRVPHEPSPIYGKVRDAWDAVASDVALHGFAYLGVLLTFVGVLGFLLFAFVDIPDTVQPLVELFIALVFFAWSWALRRQKAILVSKGMELIGGMVLPLILFAGLVDNAPFPPDFENGALVVALTVSAFLLSMVYIWISSRWPDSMLRFLVAPLWWLAAMTVGFAFKTDEPLRSDAIARLVSEQPALASAGLAITLVACRWKPRHRFAVPTVTAALFGVPVAYLLTLALAGSEGWVHPAPLVVLGVATFASVELLVGWFDRTRQLIPLRPLLLAGVLIPLSMALEVPWVGLIATVSFIAVFEFSARQAPDEEVAHLLTAAGAVIGAGFALSEPWLALPAFTMVTVWSHYRRTRPAPPREAHRALGAVAMFAPIGIGYSIVRLMDSGPDWLTMSLILLVGTAVIRRLRSDDPFWAYWPSTAASVVALGATLAWTNGGREDPWAIAAVAICAVALGMGRRRPMVRLWVMSALLSLALAMVMETAGWATDQRSLTWASMGLALVAASGVWRRVPAGHLAAVGHLVGLGAVLARTGGEIGALIAGQWSVGWVVSVAAGETGEDAFTSLLVRTARTFKGRWTERFAAGARWVAPVAMVGSIPPAVLMTAELWDDFAAHRTWTGISLATIGALYAGLARVVRYDRPLQTLFAVGAIAATAVGIALASPDRWPMILASVAVLAAAALVPRDLRPTAFVWFAWVVAAGLVLLVAEKAGVPFESLDLVALALGAALLIGGLVVDDLRSGRRRPGDYLREAWLRYPVVIGAAAVSIAMGLIFTREPDQYGWWSLATAAGLLVAAYLLRAGSVMVASYGLLTVGVTALANGWMLDHPWRMAAIAAPLLVISWLAERLQSTEVASKIWLRWDLPPLVVAHGIGGFALAVAPVEAEIAPTALVFGVLSVVVGLWKRARIWIEAGNLLVLAAAFDAGTGWLTLALAATAVRAGIGAYFAQGSERLSYQLTGATSAGLSWLAFALWQEFTLLDAVNYSAVAWGAFALALTGLGRFWRLQRDSVQWWGAVSVVIMAIVLVIAINPYGVGIHGLWLAVGIAMMAGAFELGWKSVDALLRFAAMVAAGIGWICLALGLGWSTTQTSTITAVSFGAFLIVVAEVARLRSGDSPQTALTTSVTRGWVTLGMIGVLAPIAVEVTWNGTTEAGYGLAAGLGLAAFGSARAAKPLGVGWFREGSALAVLGSVSFLCLAIGWTDVGFAVLIVVLGAASTFLSLAIWHRLPSSAWRNPLIVFGVAANLEASALAVRAWPARSLPIALLLSVGVQAVAVGLSRDRPGVLSGGPPLIGAAFVLAMSESLSGSAQWYTLPIGLVVLSELEILRKVRRDRDDILNRPDALALEAAGVGLIVGPALVEMFTSGIVYGLVAFAAAAFCLLWAIVTRVRRRVIAAASIAIAASVLMIFAAAAAGSPESAFMWIVAVGAGFTMMLIAAVVEAYRSKRGHLMTRFDQLTVGWE